MTGVIATDIMTGYGIGVILSYQIFIQPCMVAAGCLCSVSDGDTYMVGHVTHLPLDKMAANLADNIFRCIFMNEKFCFSIWISLKFVPRGQIDNWSALIQVMACRWTGNKPLPEPRLTQFTEAYMQL